MSSENAHSPTIIRAGVADIPQIRAMAGVAFPATYAAIITPEQMAYMMQMMYAEEVLRREMTELDIAWFIARQADGVPSGFVSIGRDDSHIATAAPGAPTASDVGGDVGGGEAARAEVATDIPLFHLHKIYVLPACQRQGLGRRLFHAATAYARSEAGGRCRIELNVNRRNKALDFYRREGMQIARTGDFPIGGGFYMNDYIMAIEL
ncbi:MAG: GNAT family N-acetyltransferase [Alloprevotella sp.]|nr:GNAT family N-acetyltransferase [Alloprevotella sp.]